MGDGEQQKYCTGASHQVGGQPVHILLYTTGLPEHPQMVKTRTREIEQNHPQARVFSKKVDDLGKITDVADQMTRYGPTREFSIWSHAALDGPTGEVDVSRPKEDRCFTLDDQLYLDEWGSIDFQWAPRSFAVFYGCRTAMGYDKEGGELQPVFKNDPEMSYSKTAFAYQFLQRHPSLFASVGQPWYTMPSVYSMGKQWEPSGYSEGESVYSVAWRGAETEGGSWYLGGIDDEVRRYVYRDKGKRMRLFYRWSEEEIELARVWPNVTVDKIDHYWEISDQSIVAVGGG